MTEIPHIKLSDLTRQIADHIKLSFGTQYFWIVAEISGHKPYANPDRHYFDFVEKIEGQNVETAKVKGIAWTGGAANIKHFETVTGQKFGNGIQVLAQVRVEFHAIHGFSLILTNVDPSYTLGNLERQRRETLLKLVALNPGAIAKAGEEYVTRNKQLPLRAVLQKIALVASPNSEGYNDFIHTMKVNQFGYKFHIDEYQSSVQGALAEHELVSTLIRIYNSQIQYDCVVIVRGGGAKTDFLVFDTYRVAQAVAKFPIPVITGIGHHKDISIVDLMAHTITKTPTKAAELIIAHARSFEEAVQQAQRNIIIKSQQLLNNTQQAIGSENLLVVSMARQLLNGHREQLAAVNQEVVSDAARLLQNTRAALADRQQAVLTRSTAKLHASATSLARINQGIITKTNRILFNSDTALTGTGQAIKQRTQGAFYQAQRRLDATSQSVWGSSRTALHTRQAGFAALVNKITARPLLLGATRAANLRHTAGNIQLLAGRYLDSQKSRLEQYQALVKAMSPDNILKKGFAMVSQNGRVLKDSKSVAVGSNLVITMNDTEINTNVISKTQKNGSK